MCSLGRCTSACASWTWPRRRQDGLHWGLEVMGPCEPSRITTQDPDWQPELRERILPVLDSSFPRGGAGPSVVLLGPSGPGSMREGRRVSWFLPPLPVLISPLEAERLQQSFKFTLCQGSNAWFGVCGGWAV